MQCDVPLLPGMRGKSHVSHHEKSQHWITANCEVCSISLLSSWKSKTSVNYSVTVFTFLPREHLC